ncbi:MAG TPA: hypothetical protein VLS90_21435 [Thermodesulfobacteriota bacterium]|nr:hypothetical protein [Thermodesulfobacteriota bacterium]
MIAEKRDAVRKSPGVGRKEPGGLAAAKRRIRDLEAELDAVRGRVVEEREKRRAAEETLRKREPVLTERVKEISCLYSVVTLLTSREYKSEEARITDVVKLIPTGWYYPEDAWAEIAIAGKAYRTANYADTPWRQAAEISVVGEPLGRLTVGYLKEKPAREEGPFWLEERTLVDVLAKLIGEIAGPRFREERFIFA